MKADLEIQAGAPCQLLEWDSAFFQMPIARANSNRLSAALSLAIDEWCLKNEIICLYFMAEPSNGETVLLAEQNGYHLVDVRLTFGWSQGPSRQEGPLRDTTAVDVRLARDEDIEPLKAIARVSFTDSRFYTDRRFPRSLCDRLYEVWIERSCRGYADVVLVAVLGGRPCGFVTLHFDRPEAAARIGLLGISPESHGRGIGSLLLYNACRETQLRKMSQLQVVTQGRNLAAQRLYQRSGFLSDRVELFYHKWYG